MKKRESAEIHVSLPIGVRFLKWNRTAERVAQDRLGEEVRRGGLGRPVAAIRLGRLKQARLAHRERAGVLLGVCPEAGDERQG